MKACATDELEPKVGVRLGGAGGQGLVLAGRLLAEAAGVNCGLNVVFTKSYGPEARGGASRSDVILGPGEVDDLVSDPVDVLVCLSQKSCDRYFPSLAYRGFLLVDSTNVSVVPTSRAVELPLSELAARKCGGKMVTNVLALSVMCAMTDIVTRAALKDAVKRSVRKDFLEQNTGALDFGYRLAREHIRKMTAKQRSEIPDLRCLREAVRKPGARRAARQSP